MRITRLDGDIYGILGRYGCFRQREAVVAGICVGQHKHFVVSVRRQVRTEFRYYVFRYYDHRLR